MPTISINLRDLEQLLNSRPGDCRPREALEGSLTKGSLEGSLAEGLLTVEQLEPWLRLVKGELKDHDPDTDELRIELQDSNRPDLWCAEGIARQIHIKQSGRLSPYSFFGESAKRQIRVSADLESVRPYIAACMASGHAITQQGLIQIIQTQEKLAEIFGRKRRTVSIGFYRLAKIVFPVSYALVKPDEAHFTPLGMEERMSLREILAVHPKGLEFGPILAGHERVPILRDQEGQVLSFPPVINSRELGEVQVGDRDLLLEVTGTDLQMVMLTLNILAVNLDDRGATIEPITVTYPYETALGRTVRAPWDLGKARSITVKTIEASLGQPLGAERIRDALMSYGYEAHASREEISVKLPPYRNDVMHPVDVVEDVAISEGYEVFTPVMPSQFTVGALSKLEQVSDRLRDLMVGAGFQEIMSNIMGSRQDMIERMRLARTAWDQLVEVDNVMSQTYACLRASILPSLLRVESASTRAFYPHRIFEIGEIAVPAPDEQLGSQTLVTLGGSIAHATANFSEAHSVLDLVLYYMRQAYSLEPIAHPSFLEGRAGRIVLDGKGVGLIGELHPEVLESWQVSMPVVAFEFQVNSLAREG